MTFLSKAAAEVARALHSHLSINIDVVLKPNRTPGFDFQCNDVLSIASKLGQSPRAVAAGIVEAMANSHVFDTVSVGGPGFINLKLSTAFLEKASMHLQACADLGLPDLGRGQRVVIDFGGPNVPKPLHVGHLRSFVIGESLQRILKAVGYEVISDIHWGDWGLQMGMLLFQISREHKEAWVAQEVPEFDIFALEAMYRAAAKASKEDDAVLAEARRLTQELQGGNQYLRAVWSKMREVSLSSIAKNIEKLGARFDLMLGESDVNDLLPSMIEELKDKCILRPSDGALVADVADDKPPLIVVKSDGAALYGATDLATIKQRTSEMAATKILYVVDQRQEQHLQSVFAVARKAGYDLGASFIHVAFGTVNGKDGKPFKTRDGGVAKLTDLLETTVEQAKQRVSDRDDAIAEMIAVGALKFADLSTDRLSGYVFDPERMTAPEGKTGPYLQYACVRIESIVAKAGRLSVDKGEPEIVVSHECERQLLLACLNYPVAVQAAAERYQPKEIAEFAFSLAQAFSRFYAECQVVEQGRVNESRLAICRLVGAILNQCHYLLGIDVPKRM